MEIRDHYPKYVVTRTSMPAARGTDGALVDHLNGYRGENGKYPDGWLHWKNTAGSYPVLFLCLHENTTIITYDWNDAHTVCTSTERCPDCDENILIAESTDISVSGVPADCQTIGTVTYTAHFENGHDESVSVDGIPGPHHYVDFICEHCHGELLAEAKAAAIAAINTAAGDSTDAVVVLLKNAAINAINSAEKVADVLQIRDTYVSAIEKLTGGTSAHEHTFSADWSHNATHHWHDSTCEHTGYTSGFGEHSFGTDGKCTVCGYEQPVTPPVHEHTRIGDISVYTPAGEAQQTIPAGQCLVTVPVTNVQQTDSVTVLIASYTEAGQYRGMAWVSFEDLPVGVTVKATLPLDNSKGLITEVRAFVVSSIFDATPLGSAVSFGTI